MDRLNNVNVSNMSNSELITLLNELYNEFNVSGAFIMKLMKHMDKVEELFIKIDKELILRNKQQT